MIRPKPQAHVQTMTKEPAKFQIDPYKTCMESSSHKVPTICSQKPKSKKENNSARRIPKEKKKKKKIRICLCYI